MLTDHFIRYTRAYATRKKTAKTTANHLYNDFILRFGIPSKLLHDQGGEFEKEIFIKNLKLWTTSKHPQANKLTESMNQTVLSMLSTLPEKYKSNWKNYLNKVIHAYHCTRQHHRILPILTQVWLKTKVMDRSHPRCRKRLSQRKS